MKVKFIKGLYPYEAGDFGDFAEDRVTGNWDLVDYVEVCEDQSSKTAIKKEEPATVTLGEPVEEKAVEPVEEEQAVHIQVEEEKAVEDAPNKSMESKSKSNK